MYCEKCGKFYMLGSSHSCDNYILPTIKPIEPIIKPLEYYEPRCVTCGGHHVGMCPRLPHHLDQWPHTRFYNTW
jgi:hypothetical protein